MLHWDQDRWRRKISGLLVVLAGKQGLLNMFTLLLENTSFFKQRRYLNRGREEPSSDFNVALTTASTSSSSKHSDDPSSSLFNFICVFCYYFFPFILSTTCWFICIWYVWFEMYTFNLQVIVCPVAAQIRFLIICMTDINANKGLFSSKTTNTE